MIYHLYNSKYFYNTRDLVLTSLFLRYTPFPSPSCLSLHQTEHVDSMACRTHTQNVPLKKYVVDSANCGTHNYLQMNLLKFLPLQKKKKNSA